MLSCVPIMQMRSVSVELEILGRHQHPELTIPFLKVIFLLFGHSIYLGFFMVFLVAIPNLLGAVLKNATISFSFTLKIVFYENPFSVSN